MSYYTQSMSNVDGAEKAAVSVEEKTTVESPVKPSKTIKEIQSGELLKVSDHLYPPLPTEIKI